jgi:hypothetical protein
MLNGPEVIKLRDALVATFNREELLELVLLSINEDLGAIVARGPLKNEARDLVQWADRRDVIPDLVRAAYAARPRDASWRDFQDLYGAGPRVSIQVAGEAHIPAGATFSGLEAIVKPLLKTVDMDVWRDRYTSIERQVCRVEIEGAPKGTGFLIGPDIALTNFHVLESVISDPSRAPLVVFRFDYKRLADGSVLHGITTTLAQNDWLLDAAKYSRFEGEGRPDDALPAVDELDFAAVRLATAVGSESVGPGASVELPKRGWVDLPGVQPPLPRGAPILIAQHPQGEPIKLAIDTESVLCFNGNETRVRYKTNTDKGSSGSPCFDMDWTLVALHHMGDPEWRNPDYNEGVPIGLIRARLAARGLLRTV